MGTAYSRLALLAVILLGLATGWPAAAQVYTITDLGTLSGGKTYAHAINEYGAIVGNEQSGGHPRAFTWRPSSPNGTTGVMTDIGIDDSVARDINNGGKVVGYEAYGPGAAAFLWIDSNGDGVSDPTEITAIGDPTMAPQAFGINELDQIVGTEGASPVNAFRYSDGSLVTLSPLDSVAYAVNEGGQVVGYTGAPFQRAFRWTDSNGNGVVDPGEFKDLGTLLGGAWSIAYAINNLGDVVGEAKHSSGARRGFLWTDKGGMQDVGTLGGTNSLANAIDNLGRVVGWAQTPGGVWHAFLRTTGPLFLPVNHDLNDLLPAGSGWALIDAFDINDQGQIVGYGINPSGQERGFLMTPLIHLTALAFEPSTVVGGNPALLRATLDAPAPAGGVIVTLSGGPGSLVIPAGATSATVSVATAPVASQMLWLVRGALGAEWASAGLKIRPIGVGSLTIKPNQVPGGSVTTGTVTLERPAAPGNISVSLTSANPAIASVPTKITIPAGSSTGTFSITTTCVTANTKVSIQAQANGISKIAVLGVERSTFCP